MWPAKPKELPTPDLDDHQTFFANLKITPVYCYRQIEGKANKAIMIR